jgi:hypothetical protein
LTSREFLDNSALPRNEDAIRKTKNFGKIRRDHHNGESTIGEVVDDLMEIGDCADVDTSGRLVEYHKLWFLHE